VVVTAPAGGGSGAAPVLQALAGRDAPGQDGRPPGGSAEAAAKGTAPASGGVVPVELRVATFNLRNFTAQDGENSWAFRVGAVAEAMRATGAAVIGTQEGYLAMLRDLEPLLPEFRWEGLGRRGDGEDEFCAVFHRPEAAAEEVGHFWLSETPDVPGSSSWGSSLPRMCTWVRLRLAGGQRLLCYNTHLDHQSAEARERGIRLICARLFARRQEDGLPALLLGDLNATPDSAVVRFLREESGLVDSFGALGGADPGGTFHAFRGGGGPTIDYIFGTPDLAFAETAVCREPVAGRHPSDHHPVAATVRLPADPGGA
jgi:endonuclease/exonuclease/phosphatase family metal-dependent hydrolase